MHLAVLFDKLTAFDSSIGLFDLAVISVSLCGRLVDVVQVSIVSHSPSVQAFLRLAARSNRNCQSVREGHTPNEALHVVANQGYMAHALMLKGHDNDFSVFA